LTITKRVKYGEHFVTSGSTIEQCQHYILGHNKSGVGYT
jgi:hypothetical protein